MKALSLRPVHRVGVAVVLLALTLLAVIAARPAAAAPSGQLTWAVHISLAPTWFDPAETPSLITPFMTLYAMHDALVKFMPGAPQGKSLAESWLVSKDGLVYEFVLRKGVTFHNGDPVTADDVKFSFERYRGAAAKLLKDRVAAVEIVDPHKMRFRLKKPWLDFMTFFATPATGAAWIVPKKYVEKVGEDGFKKASVGAGPYRFVSFKPGVELVLEAYEGYWRKAPAVKRLVFRVIPDESTGLAALKRGEVDMSVRDIKAPFSEVPAPPSRTGTGRRMAPPPGYRRSSMRITTAFSASRCSAPRPGRSWPPCRRRCWRVCRIRDCATPFSRTRRWRKVLMEGYGRGRAPSTRPWWDPPVPVGGSREREGGLLRSRFASLRKSHVGGAPAPPPPSQERHSHDDVTKSAAAASAFRPRRRDPESPACRGRLEHFLRATSPSRP